METDLQITSSATVRNARDIQDQCLAALAGEGAIHINIAGITDADLSFVQLLQALRTAAEAAGRVVRLRSPAPAPVAALLERAGFLAAPSPQDLDFWFHGEAVQ